MANDIRVQHMLWSFLLTVRLIIVYSCYRKAEKSLEKPFYPPTSLS